MSIIILLAVSIAVISAAPRNDFSSDRILGGTLTTIDRWPEMANVMFSSTGVTFSVSCGGIIITNRSVLSAAHCFRSPGITQPTHRYRLRLGSSYPSTDGVIHNIGSYILHPDYDVLTRDSDIVIMRSATTFVYSDVVQRGTIAGTNYHVGDDEAVWAIGYGRILEFGSISTQLRELQVLTINQDTCAERYGEAGTNITANMLCTGRLDVSGPGQCQGDFGGPIFHNRVVVGVISFNRGCGQAYYPGVNVRVSRFSTWIQAFG